MPKKKLRLNLPKKSYRNDDSKRVESNYDFARDKVMSEQNFTELQDIIYSTSGVYISGGNKYRINQFVNENLVSMNLDNVENYLEFLRRPDGKKEVYDIVGRNSLHNDKFFVDNLRLETLVTDILPEIIEKKITDGQKDVKFWFTNTSRGEEVYSVAIILAEKIIPQYPEIKFELIASDINKSLLEFAKEGVYDSRSVENMSDELLEKYFSKRYTKYRINDEIKDLIKFKKIVLFDNTQIATLPPIDIVFCSSVLVYFDRESRTKLVKNMKRAMKKDGLIILGKNESLGSIDHGFDLLHYNKLMVYKYRSDNSK